MSHFCIKLFFFLILSSTIYSQTKSTSKEIEVIGKQNSSNDFKSTKKDSVGFTETIQAEDFKNRYTSLPEILEREAGVRIKRFGGLGSYSTLSIRGSNANQVQIYIDGIPLNNSQGGEINIADLAFDNLDRIEIYKSGMSSGLSNSAIGGTVNLITKKKDFKPSTRVNISGGSFNTYKVFATRVDSYKDIQYSLTVGKEKSDQNYIFKTDNGTPFFNPYDDKDIRRKNSQFDRNFFTGNMNFEIGKTKISLLNDFAYRKNGIPGPGNRQTEKVEREYLRNTISMGTNTPEFFSKNIFLETRSFYTGSRDHLFDPLSEFSTGTPNSRASIAQYGFHLLPSYYLNQANTLRFFFGLERETFIRDRRNRFDEIIDRSTKKFRTYSFWQIQHELKLFKERLTVLTGIHHFDYKDQFNSLNDPLIRNEVSNDKKTNQFTNYRLGFNLSMFKNKNHILNFKSNISRESRIPNFLELFGERGSIIGNLNLKRERSLNYDTGFVHTYFYKELKILNSISFFQKDIFDMILFIPNSQFTLRPENIDSARIRGFEFSQKLFWNQWKFESNYTYQKAINTSDINFVKGKYLPLRPLHEWLGFISYSWKRFEIGFESVFIGAVFKDRTNEYQNYQPARWIYNTFFSYKIIPFTEEKSNELSIHFEIKNINDTRAEDIIGYPLPGRMYYTSLNAKF
jgi:iron complex outermembrane receptor protein